MLAINKCFTQQQLLESYEIQDKREKRNKADTHTDRRTDTPTHECATPSFYPKEEKHGEELEEEE